MVVTTRAYQKRLIHVGSQNTDQRGSKNQTKKQTKKKIEASSSFSGRLRRVPRQPTRYAVPESIMGINKVAMVSSF